MHAQSTQFQSAFHHQKLGFTLIEVVITLLVLGVLSAFIGRPLIDLIQARTNVSNNVERQADIEYALSRMAKEIRLSTADEYVEKCSDTGSKILKIGKESYEIKGGNVVLGGQILIENIGNNDFTCKELEPEELDLYLYELTVANASVRAFKRAH